MLHNSYRDLLRYLFIPPPKNFSVKPSQLPLKPSQLSLRPSELSLRPSELPKIPPSHLCNGYHIQ